jgi:hypothetical protein
VWDETRENGKSIVKTAWEERNNHVDDGKEIDNNDSGRTNGKDEVARFR